MMEIILHILEQFDWNEIKDALYVTAPMLITVAGLLLGMINPWLGLAWGTIVAPPLIRLAGLRKYSLLRTAAGAVITMSEADLPTVKMTLSGIGIWKAMGEMFRRAVEIGMKRHPWTLPEPIPYPIPGTWHPKSPVYNKWPFPEWEDPVPSTQEPTLEDLFKDLSWVPDLDKILPNWRNMSVEQIAKAMGLTVKELLSMLGLGDTS